jgi:hypothetical protein
VWKVRDVVVQECGEKKPEGFTAILLCARRVAIWFEVLECDAILSKDAAVVVMR